MKPKLLKHIWRPTISDSLTFMFLCAGLGLVLYFLDINFNQRLNSPKGEQIGTLIIKRNIAQRKLANQVIWEDTSQGKYPLYNQDTIRTGKFSSALIRLNDKSEIDMDESTLLVMDIVNKETNINFASGSIRIKREETEGGLQKLKVHSKNHVVSLNKANLNLKAAENRDKLDVLVNSGKAAVSTAEGEKYDVDENEQLSFTEGEKEFRKIPITLKSPPDGYRFTFNTTKNNKKVGQSFEWELEKNTRPRHFEISRSSSFSSILIKKPVRGQEIKLRLEAGNYYWRLSFFSIGVRELQYTPNFKLSLIANEVFLRGFAVQKNESSSDADLRKPPVSFSWNEIPSASAYVLDLSREPGLSRILKSYTLSSLNLNLKLAVGEYYWRVKARTNAKGQAIQSKIYPLKVYKPQKKESSDSASFLLSLLKGKASKAASNSVAAPPEKLSTTKALSLTKPSPNIKTNEAKEPKIKEPKIEPETPKESIKEAEPPKVKQKEVKAIEVKAIEAPILRRPAQGYLVHPLVLETKGILFSWTMDPRLKSTELVIAKDSSFSQKQHEQIVSGKNEAKIQIALEPGLYYWRITGLKDSQRNSPPSKIYSFTVRENKIDEIILKKPESEFVFFPGAKSKASFEWEKVSEGGEANTGLSYEFQLAKDRALRNIIKKLVTKDTKVTLVRPKKSARYYWRVRISQENIVIAKSEVRSFSALESNSYIELRNGKKIQGRITKVAGGYVHISTPDGNFKYSMDEVADVSY